MWRTRPTFWFESSDSSDRFVTGSQLPLTVIPSLCWRYWVSKGGSPGGDIREVTEFTGEEKEKGSAAVTDSLCD